MTVLHMGPARAAGWSQQSRIWGSGHPSVGLQVVWGANKVLIHLSCYYLPAVVN